MKKSDLMYATFGVDPLEAQTRIMSQDFTLLTPREGYETAWEEQREAMERVREMMREERWGKC